MTATTLSVSPAGVLTDAELLAATTTCAVDTASTLRRTALLLALAVDKHADTGSLTGPHAWELLHLSGDVAAAHTAMHAEQRVDHDRPCTQIPDSSGCSTCLAVHADHLDQALDAAELLLGQIDGGAL